MSAWGTTVVQPGQPDGLRGPGPAGDVSPAPVRPRGWLRRNAWGLALMLPLAAGLFALNYDAMYERNFSSLPKRAAAVDETGQAVLNDYRIRLVELTPVKAGPELDDLLARKARLPSSVRPWRALFAFGAPDASIAGCRLTLLDDRGRAFSPGPPEFAAMGQERCTPDDDLQSSPYLTTMYFLLPAESRPASVRIVWAPLLPSYVLLPVPRG